MQSNSKACLFVTEDVVCRIDLVPCTGHSTTRECRWQCMDVVATGMAVGSASAPPHPGDSACKRPDLGHRVTEASGLPFQSAE